MTALPWYGLLTAAAVGLSAGYVGSLMVLRRMALVGDALSHVALPGLAVGLLLGFNPYVGAFAFVLAAAFVTWIIERSTQLTVDAVVGVLFVLALAVGVLLTPEPDLLEALFGSPASVGPGGLVDGLAVTLVAVLATRAIYRPMVLSVISEDLAASAGVRVAAVSLAYLTLVSLVVAVGVQVVGTLLVGALVIVPAAAAKLLGTNLRRFATLSAILGLGSAAGGTALSVPIDVPAGPLVVLLGVAAFAIAWVAFALLRRRAEGPTGPRTDRDAPAAPSVLPRPGPAAPTVRPGGQAP